MIAVGGVFFGMFIGTGHAGAAAPARVAGVPAA
jgi:hypothetical protein